eukprot:1157770-Pelagomonas_calceolata.AAC.11
MSYDYFYHDPPPIHAHAPRHFEYAFTALPNCHAPIEFRAKSWGSSGRGTGNKVGPPLGCMYTDMVLLAREPMATASYADRHAHALGIVHAFT